MAAKKKNKIGVWIIIGLLFVGLLGFGTTDISSTNSTLAEVGETEITVREYANALQSQLNDLSERASTPVSFAQAQAFGLPEQVLRNLISARVLENEVMRMGLSVGDQEVTNTILNSGSFNDFDGTFSRDIYAETLARAGLNEADYERSIRNELAASMLQIALLSGVQVPPAYTDTALNFIAEQRDITWAAITTTDAALPEPSSDDLLAYYAENPQDFTAPEMRKITYAAVTPDMLLYTIEVDEAALQALYQDRFDQYNQPERRLVERLGFINDADAQAALNAIKAGETDFDTLVSERGLTLNDVDLGDVTQTALAEAGAGVFSAQTGEVVGPLPSTIGPALFRINAVLAAQNTPYEQAQAELRAELGADRARRKIAEGIEDINNLIAGGAQIEDIAENTVLEQGQIEWTAALTDGIAGYPAFRTAAQATQIDALPALIEFRDGGLAVLRVDEINQAAVIPFEDVADDVRSAVVRQARQNAILEQAGKLAGQLNAETDFAALGLSPQTETGLSRRSFVDRTPADFITTVFNTHIGDTAVLPYDDAAVLLRVDAVHAPDPQDRNTAALKTTIEDQITNALAVDLFQSVIAQIQAETDIRINQAAVNGVHANIQ